MRKTLALLTCLSFAASAFLCGNVFAQTDSGTEQESVVELEATETRIMDSDPITDPEKDLGEEVRDEEIVDSDA